MRRWFAILILLVASHCANAGEPAAPTPATNAIATAESVPVPVPAPSELALRRYHTSNGWWCVRTAWDIAAPALILFSGLSARLRNIARRLGRKWYFSLCIYVALLTTVFFVLTLPLDYYLGFVRAHFYGLSNQTFSKWLSDALMEQAALVVIGWLVLWLPYLLIRKSPRHWWFYAGLAMIPVYFAGQLAKPLVFDPLFNQFTEIHDKSLEQKILALAERAGIHDSRVYEVKKSVDTKTVNAYVTGFLGTKRIVLWDTALAKLDEHELLFVMGHEMGHYALGHVVKGILCLAALTFVALYGLHRLAAIVIRRCKNRFGFDEPADMASLPLAILLLNLFALILMPIGFAYSRHLEHEADRFGLELTHFNHSAATGFARLQEENLSVPRPGWFYTLWRGTHPSIGDRIDFFNTYKPWESGAPLQYEDVFIKKP
jgi:STE24 endopeptidase